MATFPKEHDKLYFDALIRTQKGESLLSMIQATYHAKKSAKKGDDVKAMIAKRLKDSYALFRDNVRGYDDGVGSYTGTEDQFASQYTLGHEMAIWLNSNLDLNPLAIQVAENKITVRDYLDVVLLNYVQPVNGVCVHPLYQMLKCLDTNDKKTLTKEEMKEALEINSVPESINALYNILIASNYFESTNVGLIYIGKLSVSDLLSLCDTRYIGEDGYILAKTELEDDANYNAYITKSNDFENREDESEVLICTQNEEVSEENFIKWLSCHRKKDGNLLNETQQKGYYFILKAIPSMLGISSPFSVTNYDEFCEYRKEIEKSEHYKIANDGVGSGVLSAALTNYGKYLEETASGYYPLEMLLDILKEWYSEKYVQSNITSTLVGFGFKYAESIRHAKISARKMLEMASIDSTMQAYIDRGIDLYYAVKEKSIGFSFVEERSISKINYVTDCVNIILNDKNEEVEVSRNRIFFGAPGTGKSHELDKQVQQFVGDDSEYYERVMFHPEYNHSSFFGTYKPVPNPSDKDKITYAFIPGPFLRVLTKALINANSGVEKKPYVLIIEEINRANVSSVFGEVFQLLDREGEDKEFLNASKYSISPSEDVKKYLVNEFQKVGLNANIEMFTDIRIPDNMFIWASMNSADQGVFPMDTAFKRRWDFEYFGINRNEEKIDNYYFKVNESVIYWNVLRKAINKRLTSLKINEDKLMGPFFLSKDVLYACVYDHSKVIKAIQNKVLMYLFEDAGRQKRKDIFVGGYEKTYSEICKDFETDGLSIFVKEIIDEYNAILDE